MVGEQAGGIVQAIADGGLGAGAVGEFDGVVIELRGGGVEAGEAVGSGGGLTTGEGPEGLLRDGRGGGGYGSGTVIANDAVGRHLRGKRIPGSGGVGDARDKGRAGPGICLINSHLPRKLGVLRRQSGGFRGVQCLVQVRGPGRVGGAFGGVLGR